MQIIEKATATVAYTEIQKRGYSLLFENSQNTDDLKKLKSILEAPLKVEAPLEVRVSYTQIEKEKKARNIEAASKQHHNQLKQLEKQRLANLKVEPEKADAQITNIVEVDPGDIARTTPKPKSLKSKEPKYKGEFNYRLSFTMIAELFNSTPTPKKVMKDFDKIYATEEEKPLLYAFNDLYITERSQFLEMRVNKDGKSYYTTEKPFNGGKYALVDSVIIQHLRQERTIGVFAGEYLTNFLCFDIDNEKDLEVSKKIAADVIDVLVNSFKVDKKYITTSYSGNKGYHVELFFEKTVDKSAVKKLYKAVLPLLKPLNGALVELRPTRQGLKLPLSIHKGTGNVCNYVDMDSFEEVGRERLLTIQKLPIENLKKIMNNKRLFSLSTKKAKEMEKLSDSVKSPNATKAQKETDIVNILSSGKLVRTSSRHNITFKGAVFLFSQGQLKADTIFILKELIDNTWLNARHLINEKTTKQEAYEDIKKTTNYVYEHNIIIGDSKPEIVVYQSEMESIFNLPKLHLKKIAFSFLQHSKKFSKADGTFYMTYSTLTEMGNAQNRQDLLNSIKILEDAGFMRIVSRNVISKGLSIEYGRIMSEPNHYIITIPAPSEEEPYITLNTNKKIDFVKIAPKLISIPVLKAKSTAHVYKKYFKL